MKIVLQTLLLVLLAVPIFVGAVVFVLWSACSFGWLFASNVLEDFADKLN